MHKENACHIRLYRRLANRTQWDLAVALDRSQSWVSLVELGHRELTANEIDQVADELGVPTSALFADSDENGRAA